VPDDRFLADEPPNLVEHASLEPFDDDPGAVAALLGDVSVPALIASIVQLTGDPSLVRGDIRPPRWIHNEFQGGLDEDERAELRRVALEAILAWRDAGYPAPPPLDDAVVREVMDWVACRPVPEPYVAMYAEEMDLAGADPRAIHLSEEERVRAEGFSVLIIGCGESGLLAALRLQQAGIPFTVVEKNDDVGGTWLENTYPGCRVDVASHYYSYSFGPTDAFGEYWAQQPELHRYFRRLLEEHGIGEHVRWRTEVERAAWDDDDARWEVSVRRADGTTEVLPADAIISGVGILNRPSIPELPGLDRFAGPVFHSARWDHDVDLRGTRVALIGAGASGFQIGPAIVDDVEALTVFQRTPQWMAPNPKYRAPVATGERWALRHLPGYERWIRFMHLWQGSDRILELVRMDPEWEDFPRTANKWSASQRTFFADWISHQLADDPDLAARVTPDYPPMTKRVLQDDGSWLRCLARPHVELVSDAITAIDETGITVGDHRYEVDVIVLATGFRANEILWPMEVVGRDGRALEEVWSGAPAAFAGVSVPGFPNFFVLNGPGTGLAHGGSVIFMSECQMRYVGDCLRTLLDGDHRSIEPTVEAYERWRDDLVAETATMMWGHPSVEHSWYKAADGNVYLLCPWPILDYWRMTARAEPDDHLVT
jgi:4-hydroxyacetophenone monooxygenase